MHEAALVRSLVARAVEVVAEAGAERAARIEVRVGALAHLDPEAAGIHFAAAVTGTPVESAELVITRATDPSEAGALDVVLTSVDVVGGE